jgi:hypothetical protein
MDTYRRIEIKGKQNKNGNYELTPLEMKQLNDNFRFLWLKVFGNIDTADLMNESVKTRKLGKKAVTREKIEDLAIGTAQIEDASITDAKIDKLQATKIFTGEIRGLDGDYVNMNNIKADNIKAGGTITGVKYVSQDADDRMEIIGDELSTVSDGFKSIGIKGKIITLYAPSGNGVSGVIGSASDGIDIGSDKRYIVLGKRIVIDGQNYVEAKLVVDTVTNTVMLGANLDANGKVIANGKLGRNIIDEFGGGIASGDLAYRLCTCSVPLTAVHDYIGIVNFSYMNYAYAPILIASSPSGQKLSYVVGTDVAQITGLENREENVSVLLVGQSY